MEPLEFPEQFEDSPNLREVMRVWGSRNQQHMSIDLSTNETALEWGIILADLVRHLGKAYEQLGTHTAAEAERLVKERFDESWADPANHKEP